MDSQTNEAEHLKAKLEQHRRPLPYPMTEEEKRAYDYGEYTKTRGDRREDFDDNEEGVMEE